MASELSLNPEQIGRRTGKDRTTIVNFVRLLQLPADLQQLVAERRLSPGHARCLLSLPTAELQREVAEKAVAQGWSVRQMERTTQRMMEGRKPKHVDEVELIPTSKLRLRNWSAFSAPRSGSSKRPSRKAGLKLNITRPKTWTASTAIVDEP